jgi:hypothetical protein
VPDPNAPKGVNTAIIGTEKNSSYIFADGTIYNYSSLVGDAKDCGDTWLAYFGEDSLANLEENNLEKNQSVKDGYVVSNIMTFLSAADGEKYAQAIINIENAQILYIDVTRIVSVTYKHQINPDSTVALTTTTLANRDVLCHIALTKTDSGFVFGDVPDFVHGYMWRSWMLLTSAFVTMQPMVSVESMSAVFCKVVA